MPKLINIETQLIFTQPKNQIRLKIRFFGLAISLKFISPKIIDDIISDFRENIRLLIKDNTKDKTLYVRMLGRLGNQMFIHAFAKKLAEVKNKKVVYDISSKIEFNKYVLDRYYDIKTDTSQTDYNKMLPDKDKYFEKESFFYDENVFKEDALYYFGFFQTEKYFKDIRDELLSDFKTKIPFDIEYLAMKEQIENSNSILLNFRVCKDYRRLGWMLSFSYQQEAIKYIKSKVDNPKFFVFSDDIQYIKENFDIEPDTELIFVDIGKNNPNKIVLDLELMKLCKHAIIPNSTFSWWAAWLNENPNKIIVAPDPWLFNKTDILCPEWHKIKAKNI